MDYALPHVRNAKQSRHEKMKKIQLALNDFPALPLGLMDSSANQPEEISFTVDEICTHYFFAK